MLRFRQYLFGTLAFLIISFGVFQVIPLEERYPNSVEPSTGTNLRLFGATNDQQAALALGAMTLVVGIGFAVLAWRNGAAADHIKKYGDPEKPYVSGNDG
jgi:hypothetical protein